MYELMLVARYEKSDQLLSRVEKVIKDVGALGLKVDRLGKKQLAYPILKQTEGTYFVLNFEAQGVAIKSISDKLRLEQEDLLRYLITRKKDVKITSYAQADKKTVVSEGKPKVTVVTKQASKSQSIKAKGNKRTKSQAAKKISKPAKRSGRVQKK